MNGQARLTRDELRRLPTRNQHGGRGLTVVEWQVVKGAALFYEVPDWTSRADGSLTYGENAELMRMHSRRPDLGGPTMTEMPALQMEKRA